MLKIFLVKIGKFLIIKKWKPFKKKTNKKLMASYMYYTSSYLNVHMRSYQAKRQIRYTI